MQLHSAKKSNKSLNQYMDMKKERAELVQLMSPKFTESLLFEHPATPTIQPITLDNTPRLIFDQTLKYEERKDLDTERKDERNLSENIQSDWSDNISNNLQTEQFSVSVPDQLLKLSNKKSKNAEMYQTQFKGRKSYFSLDRKNPMATTKVKQMPKVIMETPRKVRSQSLDSQDN